MRFDNIELIDPPVVGLGQFKCAGCIFCSTLRLASCCTVHFFKSLTEINRVQFSTETGCPAKLCIQSNSLGVVSRNRKVCRLWRNTKAPDVTFPWAVRLGFVYFIDSPVVSRSRYKTVRNRKSWKTNNYKRVYLVTYECAFGAFINSIEVIADIHIVRDSEISRYPAQVYPGIRMESTILWIRAKSSCARLYPSTEAKLHNILDLVRSQHFIED